MSIQRVHARARRELLEAEREALIELMEIARTELNILLLSLRRTPSDLAAAQAIRMSTRRIEAALEDSILRARIRARRAAIAQLEAELEELDVDLAVDESDGADDHVAALVAAAALAALWGRSIAAAYMTKDANEDVEDVVERSLVRFEASLRRTATTENAQAWNDEHHEALVEVADQVGEDTQLMNRWDATLDAKTCPVCRDHDGELVPIGYEFPNGDVPGFVHPNCRCVSTLVKVAASEAA